MVFMNLKIFSMAVVLIATFASGAVEARLEMKPVTGEGYATCTVYRDCGSTQASDIKHKLVKKALADAITTAQSNCRELGGSPRTLIETDWSYDRGNTRGSIACSAKAEIECWFI